MWYRVPFRAMCNIYFSRHAALSRVCVCVFELKLWKLNDLRDQSQSYGEVISGGMPFSLKHIRACVRQPALPYH